MTLLEVRMKKLDAYGFNVNATSTKADRFTDVLICHRSDIVMSQ